MSKMPSNGDPKNTPWYVNRKGVNLLTFLGIFALLLLDIALFLAIFAYAPLAIPTIFIGFIVGMGAYDIAKTFRW